MIQSPRKEHPEFMVSKICQGVSPKNLKGGDLKMSALDTNWLVVWNMFYFPIYWE